MARQQARRHHRERVAGITLAVLGAIVLVVALYALRQPGGHNVADSTSPSATAARTTETSRSATPTRRSSSPPRSSASRTGPSLNLGSSTSPAIATLKKVPLVVLNDTTTTGLAASASQRFESGGWTVTTHDNIPSGITDIISSCAYYDSSVAAAKAAATALQMQYPAIKRVEPKFDGLPDGPVVVVLTSDYSTG